MGNDIKLDSVQGSPLLVNLYLKSKFYDGFITVNGKRVVKADKKASNGMVHFIDGVILPPKGDLVTTLASDERFSTLVTASRLPAWCPLCRRPMPSPSLPLPMTPSPRCPRLLSAFC